MYFTAIVFHCSVRSMGRDSITYTLVLAPVKVVLYAKTYVLVFSPVKAGVRPARG